MEAKPSISKRQRRRLALFDLYSANLAWYAPNWAGHFACPLCLRLFSKEACTGEILTIDHIVTGAVGGRAVTLTCKACNDRSGSGAEASLVGKLDVEDKLRGKSTTPLSVDLRFAEGEFPADVRFLPDGGGEIVILGRPGPQVESRFKMVETAVQQREDFHMRFSLGYRSRHPAVAVLRMGYLAMFRQFGYGYLRCPGAQIIRDQIARPEEQLMDFLGVADGALEVPDPPPYPITVGFLREPQHLRCFVVYLRLTTKSGTRRDVAVVMPGFDEGNVYARWKEQKAPLLGLSVKVLQYDIQDLTDPRARNLASRLWFLLARKQEPAADHGLLTNEPH